MDAARSPDVAVGGDADRFVGDWIGIGGGGTLSCSDGSSASLTAEGAVFRFEPGTSADLLHTQPGSENDCPLDFDVAGDRASIVPGQSCMGYVNGYLVLGTYGTFRFDYAASAGGDTLMSSVSSSITISDGASVVATCNATANGTYARLDVPDPPDAGPDGPPPIDAAPADAAPTDAPPAPDAASSFTP